MKLAGTSFEYAFLRVIYVDMERYIVRVLHTWGSCNLMQGSCPGMVTSNAASAHAAKIRKLRLNMDEGMLRLSLCMLSIGQGP